ncbi:hypothetical protein GCM10009611_15030 [Arthrobacter roseus]
MWSQEGDGVFQPCLADLGLQFFLQFPATGYPEVKVHSLVHQLLGGGNQQREALFFHEPSHGG